MSDLLADARETLADISSRRPGRTHYEGCRTEHVDCLLADLIQEVGRLRLTDAEREAVETCIADDEAATAYTRATALRGLLERMK